jgi:hypothetical protein
MLSRPLTLGLTAGLIVIGGLSAWAGPDQIRLQASPSPSPSALSVQRFNPVTGQLEVVRPGESPAPGMTMEVTPAQTRFNPMTGQLETVPVNGTPNGMPTSQQQPLYNPQTGRFETPAGGAGIDVRFKWPEASPSPSVAPR